MIFNSYQFSSIYKSLIISTMKQFNFIIIFALFFFETVKSQSTDTAYDPRPIIYEFFINIITPLIIVTVFLVGIRNNIIKHLMKLLDDLLFFGLFILLPTIYYFNVVKKTGLENPSNMFAIIVAVLVCLSIVCIFGLTIKKHSLITKLVIELNYFL